MKHRPLGFSDWLDLAQPWHPLNPKNHPMVKSGELDHQDVSPALEFAADLGLNPELTSEEAVLREYQAYLE